ncbi:hypothetical protein FEZ60_25220 [Rhodococcus sp. MS16]|nr:hypothetical protein [Rhodococcus sp. MS16]
MTTTTTDPVVTTTDSTEPGEPSNSTEVSTSAEATTSSEQSSETSVAAAPAGPENPQGPSAESGSPVSGPSGGVGGAATPAAPQILAAPAPIAAAVQTDGPNSSASAQSDDPQAFPVVFTSGLPPIQNAAAVVGGLAGMTLVAAGAGALTFRGASMQKARLAAARAEFLAPRSGRGV